MLLSPHTTTTCFIDFRKELLYLGAVRQVGVRVVCPGAPLGDLLQYLARLCHLVFHHQDECPLCDVHQFGAFMNEDLFPELSKIN